ncbi:MAG: hypothetical protein ACUVWZ_04930 [Anaerolineae bacterium]
MGFRVLVLGLLAVVMTRGGMAADPNQAGLVVQFENGRIESRCLAFAEEEISGVDLLLRSGLDVVLDSSRGMGVAVCQIDGVGCAYPAESCFCQCMGAGPCRYWNYFYRDPGQSTWTYSALGATLRTVRPGAVEAWVWGDGGAPPSPDLSFEALCASSSPILEPTSEPVWTPVPTIWPTPTGVPSDLPTLSPRPASPTPTLIPLAPSQSTLASYWPLAGMILGLITLALGIGFWRKGQ